MIIRTPTPPFQHGDELQVFYSSLGLYHYGIFRVNSDKWGNISWDVIHNSKRGGGVCSNSLEEFRDGNLIQVTRSAFLPGQAELVVKRAESQLGQRYHAFVSNCEHFTSWAYTGEAESGQLQKGVLVAMALGVVALAWNSDS